VKIIASVDGEIITNIDVLKESKYLKILNPNLKNLNEDKLLDLSRQSLIREIIKKKEISKFMDFNNEETLINEYLNNLIIKLGYEDKKSFSESLLQNESYSIEEVRLKTKIEFFWNELIFSRFNNQIIINQKELNKKLDNMNNKKTRELLLSEIVFKKKKDEKINDSIEKIKTSINEIGFENTANLYSISDSSRFGGKIGWVKEDTLSQIIYKNINNLKVNEYSDTIRLKDNFIIIKINEIREIQKPLNKEKVMQQLIQIERNKKLEKFSRIYFNRIQTQYLISEK
tara:strand:- start:144 stop:1001 length:858 start_codon:yes stop_codon:yes gene_type:complete